MLKKLMTIVVTIPVAVILIILSVANRASVPVTLDPFNPGNPGLTWSVPLFVMVLGALIIGVFLGGMVTWWRQGKYRKTAKVERNRAQEIRAEADALKAERKAAMAQATGQTVTASGLPLLAKS